DGIAQLRQLRQLERIELEHVNVTDRGITALAGLPWLRDLRMIHTQVTECGLRAFEESGMLRSLSVGPNMAPESIQDLQELLPACKVFDASGTIRFHGPWRASGG